jgi:hypothetical protein
MKPSLRRTAVRTTCLAITALVTLPVSAGRPFATEDAGVLAHRACEIEGFAGWRGASPDLERQFSVQGACGLFGHTQVAFNPRQTRIAGDAQATYSFSGKTRLAGADGKPQWAVAYSVQSDNPRPSFFRQGRSVVIVHTRPLGRNLLHANLGWSFDRVADEHLGVYAIAYEMPGLFGPVDLGIEGYGDNKSKPVLGFGARWNVRDNVSLDASAGRQFFGSSGRNTFTLGLKVGI